MTQKKTLPQPNQEHEAHSKTVDKPNATVNTLNTLPNNTLPNQPTSSTEPLQKNAPTDSSKVYGPADSLPAAVPQSKPQKTKLQPLHPHSKDEEPLELEHFDVDKLRRLKSLEKIRHRKITQKLQNSNQLDTNLIEVPIIYTKTTPTITTASDNEAIDKESQDIAQHPHRDNANRDFANKQTKTSINLSGLAPLNVHKNNENKNHKATLQKPSQYKANQTTQNADTSDTPQQIGTPQQIVSIVYKKDDENAKDLPNNLSSNISSNIATSNNIDLNNETQEKTSTVPVSTLYEADDTMHSQNFEQSTPNNQSITESEHSSLPIKEKEILNESEEYYIPPKNIKINSTFDFSDFLDLGIINDNHLHKSEDSSEHCALTQNLDNASNSQTEQQFVQPEPLSNQNKKTQENSISDSIDLDILDELSNYTQPSPLDINQNINQNIPQQSDCPPNDNNIVNNSTQILSSSLNDCHSATPLIDSEISEIIVQEHEVQELSTHDNKQPVNESEEHDRHFRHNQSSEQERKAEQQEYLSNDINDTAQLQAQSTSLQTQSTSNSQASNVVIEQSPKPINIQILEAIEEHLRQNPNFLKAEGLPDPLLVTTQDAPYSTEVHPSTQGDTTINNDSNDETNSPLSWKGARSSTEEQPAIEAIGIEFIENEHSNSAQDCTQRDSSLKPIEEPSNENSNNHPKAEFAIKNDNEHQQTLHQNLSNDDQANSQEPQLSDLEFLIEKTAKIETFDRLIVTTETAEQLQTQSSDEDLSAHPSQEKNNHIKINHILGQEVQHQTVSTTNNQNLNSSLNQNQDATNEFLEQLHDIDELYATDEPHHHDTPITSTPAAKTHTTSSSTAVEELSQLTDSESHTNEPSDLDSKYGASITDGVSFVAIESNNNLAKENTEQALISSTLEHTSDDVSSMTPEDTAPSSLMDENDLPNVSFETMDEHQTQDSTENIMKTLLALELLSNDDEDEFYNSSSTKTSAHSFNLIQPQTTADVQHNDTAHENLTKHSLTQNSVPLDELHPATNNKTHLTDQFEKIEQTQTIQKQDSSNLSEVNPENNSSNHEELQPSLFDFNKPIADIENESPIVAANNNNANANTNTIVNVINYTITPQSEVVLKESNTSCPQSALADASDIINDQSHIVPAEGSFDSLCETKHEPSSDIATHEPTASAPTPDERDEQYEHVLDLPIFSPEENSLDQFNPTFKLQPDTDFEIDTKFHPDTFNSSTHEPAALTSDVNSQTPSLDSLFDEINNLLDSKDSQDSTSSAFSNQTQHPFYNVNPTEQVIQSDRIDGTFPVGGGDEPSNPSTSNTSITDLDLSKNSLNSANDNTIGLEMSHTIVSDTFNTNDNAPNSSMPINSEDETIIIANSSTESNTISPGSESNTEGAVAPSSKKTKPPFDWNVSYKETLQKALIQYTLWRCTQKKPNPLPLLHKDDRWLAVSALQKSIRCSDFDSAINWTERLFQSDCGAYATYRLGIISLEDIAGANLALALSIMQTNLNKGLFTSLNEFAIQQTVQFAQNLNAPLSQKQPFIAADITAEHLLAQIEQIKNSGTNLLAELFAFCCSISIKDRTTCNLMNVVTNAQLKAPKIWGQQNVEFNQQTVSNPETLTNFTLNESIDLRARHLALWHLVGTKIAPSQLSTIDSQDSDSPYVPISTFGFPGALSFAFEQLALQYRNPPFNPSLSASQSPYTNEYNQDTQRSMLLDISHQALAFGKEGYAFATALIYAKEPVPITTFNDFWDSQLQILKQITNSNFSSPQLDLVIFTKDTQFNKKYKNIPLAAIDKHTSQGKQCLAKWLLEVPQIRSLLSPTGVHAKEIIENCVFFIEGHLCTPNTNRQLLNSTIIANQQYLAKSIGLPWSQIESTLLNHWEHLNELRSKSIDLWLLQHENINSTNHND